MKKMTATLTLAALLLAGCKSTGTSSAPECATYDGIGCAQKPTYTKPAPPVLCPDCSLAPVPPRPDLEV